jgi:hypothetical protein
MRELGAATSAAFSLTPVALLLLHILVLMSCASIHEVKLKSHGALEPELQRVTASAYAS